MSRTIRHHQHPWLADVLSTADATPHVSGKCSHEVLEGSSGHVRFHATLRGPSGEVASAEVSRTFWRPPGGAVQLSGGHEHMPMNGHSSLASSRLEIRSVGGHVLPTCVGPTGVDVEWQIDVRYWL